MRDKIAIIGAGMAGAVLAQRLSAAGHQVTVIEKSRGTGGRMASCRIGDTSADLGAPWFVPRSTSFCHWLKQQGLQTWTPVIRDFLNQPVSSQPIWIAAPRQSALTRQLLNNSLLLTSTRVGSVWPELENGRPRIVVRDTRDRIIDYFDKVLITAPAQQAAPLLEAIPRFSGLADAVTSQSSWVTVVTTSPVNVTADIYCGDHPVLYRCIRDSRKPARNSHQEVWTLEANSHWSSDHINNSPEQIGEQLVTSFQQCTGAEFSVLQQRSQRWLLARHNSQSDRDYLWQAELGIGACGDWLAHGGLEGSWISANALAEQILGEPRAAVA